MPTLLVENMVTVKVFKKGSQSGQLYLYLGERDYISSEGLIDDINGIAYLPNLDQMEGKLITSSFCTDNFFLSLHFQNLIKILSELPNMYSRMLAVTSKSKISNSLSKFTKKYLILYQSQTFKIQM